MAEIFENPIIKEFDTRNKQRVKRQQRFNAKGHVIKHQYRPHVFLFNKRHQNFIIKKKVKNKKRRQGLERTINFFFFGRKLEKTFCS